MTLREGNQRTPGIPMKQHAPLGREMSPEHGGRDENPPPPSQDSSMGFQKQSKQANVAMPFVLPVPHGSENLAIWEKQSRLPFFFRERVHLNGDVTIVAALLKSCREMRFVVRPYDVCAWFGGRLGWNTSLCGLLSRLLHQNRLTRSRRPPLPRLIMCCDAACICRVACDRCALWFS